jgi:hypothetical protein
MRVGILLSAPMETLDIKTLRTDKTIRRRTFQNSLLKEKLWALKEREMHFRLLNITLSFVSEHFFPLITQIQF